MKSVLTEILDMISFCFLLLPYRQMSSLFLSFLPLLPSLHFLFHLLSSILIPTPLLSVHIHSSPLFYTTLLSRFFSNIHSCLMFSYSLFSFLILSSLALSSLLLVPSTFLFSSLLFFSTSFFFSCDSSLLLPSAFYFLSCPHLSSLCFFSLSLLSIVPLPSLFLCFHFSLSTKCLYIYISKPYCSSLT